jgi:hypothetical protein
VFECAEQGRSASCWAHGAGDGGAGVELGADVVFQSLELPDEGGSVGVEVTGRSVDGGEGHDRLEAVQALPSV